MQFAASMSLYQEPKIRSNVRLVLPSKPRDVGLTCTDINSELDELDREEFYRLKKVAGKKQRDTAAADAEMKAKKAADAAKSDQENIEPADDAAPADILATGEDDDVIF